VINTDVVIVGAGPCGLFQVFELGLLGLKAEVVDSIRQPGGQCTELYPDKPIYDIPAIPECTGDELTEALLKQIEPFNCGMHLGEEVQVVRRQDDDTFFVETSSGKQFTSKAVVIAGGVGSFQPRPIRVPDVDDYTDKSLHYRVRDPKQFAGKKLVILGGGDSALDWVLELVDSAERITLVHRRDEYRAMPDSVAKMEKLVAEGRMDDIRSAKASALNGENGQVTSIVIQPKEGEAREIDADHNHYPGKKKLILCGFHEAALAAFAIKQRIEPDKKVHVQYTTTSPIMHERLGVEDSE
jgi:thioredoxin reductase (NADPH)